MKDGWCFGTASKPALREVVATLDGEELLECGHYVPFLFDIHEAPLGTYKRTCPECGDPCEDNDAFFPVRGGLAYAQFRDARRICNGEGNAGPCPVRAKCEKYARDNNLKHGVWGGTSQRERERLDRLPQVRVTWLRVGLRVGRGPLSSRLQLVGIETSGG